MPRNADPAELSLFQQQLIGTWTNQNLPGTTKGGRTSPYSYNLMPLPQSSAQSADQNTGYILKNFTYYETITFNGSDAVAVPGAAPNRGGSFQQTPYVLFYDQQVRFAEGPAVDTIVHLENGAWIYLQTEPQQIGPYLYPPNAPQFEPGEVPVQPPDITICKQISVPHGVSLLAMGNFASNTGEPVIGNQDSVLPTLVSGDGCGQLNVDPYSATLATPANYQNPQPLFTSNPRLRLQEAISDLAAAGTPVSNYIYCQVNSANQGGVLNIPFEKRKAALTAYQAEYWLLSCDGGLNYDILAYSQTITLQLQIGNCRYVFPHPTANVIVREKI